MSFRIASPVWCSPSRLRLPVVYCTTDRPLEPQYSILAAFVSFIFQNAASLAYVSHFIQSKANQKKACQIKLRPYELSLVRKSSPSIRPPKTENQIKKAISDTYQTQVNSIQFNHQQISRVRGHHHHHHHLLKVKKKTSPVQPTPTEQANRAPPHPKRINHK